MKASASFESTSPVLLSSSCDVTASNAAVPDSGLLSYPFRKAVVIEEIRFTMRLATSGSPNLGALVYAKFNLGQLYLMRSPVPVWLLGTIMGGTQEEMVNNAGLATAMAYSHYRWRLPQPLYVEAGQVLSSVFSRGVDGFGSINVQVSYVGKTVSPGQPRPQLLAVPYAAFWATTVGNTYQQSNEFDLFNPFNSPLNIQRLTGRVLSFVSGTTSAAVKSLTPATAGSDVSLLIDDSWGGKMVGNNTGPSDVFDLSRAAWTVDTVMPPKGVYVVRAFDINSARSVHIGMIGYREERL